MRTKRSLVLGTIVLLLGGLFIANPIATTQAQEQNLLANPGFEQPYDGGVAGYWKSWAENNADLCAEKPDTWDFACTPNWGQEADYNGLGLTRGGASQHVGAQYTPWHAGVYQTVEVAPGTQVRFTAFGYSRASDEQPPEPSFGGDWVPRMQVGIDPEGRGQWHAGVIWSGENNACDGWQQLAVEATAGASGKVTVFVSSQFRRVQPLAHMDTWWEDASLISVQPAATPTSPPPPTSAVPPTPVHTPTPRPDGAVVHIVQSGDTLYGIALQYGVEVDELRRLNAGTLSANDMLSIGQEIVISGAPQAPTPVPTAPPATEEPAPELTAEPTAATGEGLASLCVSAYHDRNADMLPQLDSEELLPNAQLTLVGTNGPAGAYTTDGISEPYCFENLPLGNYVLRQTPPAGYQPTGPAEWGVMLSAGQVSSLQLGYRRDTAATGEGAATVVTEEPPAETTGEESGAKSSILNIIIRVSGIIALILVLLVAGLFIISRRRS
ncbi:MAG TPA: LysM peptidoglycan-binding domain-containing protein [Thermoflexia bacterium]|nr:LysM peptidoglycan-binding domain-containing protein [Thermoflexia bacterium]